MLIVVENQLLMYPNNVPAQVRSVLSANEWRIICDTINIAEAEANMCMLCCEWTCCLLTGFCCIFCFHPCLVPLYEDPLLSRKIIELNLQLFGGNPVLSRFENGIIINNDALSHRNIDVVLVNVPVQQSIPTAIAHPV